MRNERVHSALARWVDALEKAVIGHRVTAPDVPRGADVAILRLWSRERDAVEGRAAGRLAVLAREGGLDAAAVRAVRSRRDDVRLAGVEVAGRLGVDEVWDDLVRLARSGRQPLWERAAVALTRIAGERALRLLVPSVGAELPAHAAAWSRILAASPVAAGTVLGDLLGGLPPDPQRVLTRALGAVPRGAGDALTAVRRLLRVTDDPTLAAACVAALAAHGDASDTVRVRGLVAHPEWAVRLEAAAALGRLGEASDVDALAALLDDAEWLVRRAAAESLVALGDHEQVLRLAAAHPDVTVRAALSLGLAASPAER